MVLYDILQVTQVLGKKGDEQWHDMVPNKLHRCYGMGGELKSGCVSSQKKIVVVQASIGFC